MASIPVYASTGAFITRSNGRNYRLIPEIAPLLHADGLEFMMYDSWNDEIDVIRDFLAAARLPIPVMHLDKRIGEMPAEFGSDGIAEAERLLTRDLLTADRIGAETLVLHLWSGAFSDLHFGAMLDGFERLSALARASGHRLTVENVTCRITRTLPRLRALHERYPEARFTYDTKMAQLHRENEMLPLPDGNWLFGKGLVSHLHVNDTVTTKAASGHMPVMHFGEGEVDFSSFFRYLTSVGFHGTATVESTSSRDDGSANTDAMNRSLDAVRAALNP